MSSDDAEEPLLTSPQAAKLLGISARTIQRYAKDGLITPELTLRSGQYRWKLSDLRAQIKAIGQRQADESRD